MTQTASDKTTSPTPERFRRSARDIEVNGLDKAMKAAFARDGYLLIEDFEPTTRCDALMARAAQLVEAFTPDTVASIFSTTTKSHARDTYFAESGDKIRYFFEEDAFDTAGALKQDKSRSINKIGHALHDLDPVFDAFSRQPALARMASDIGITDPRLLQSMYIFKQPRIGGEVVCHQDSSFLTTEPLSVVGLWFALEDATLDNGCLRALPGRHCDPIQQRFRRKDGELITEVLDSAFWPTDDAVALEAKKGSLILLHGQLPHLSGTNRSSKSRHAYTLHVIDGACRYLEDNWLQRDPAMPLRGF